MSTSENTPVIITSAYQGVEVAFSKQQDDSVYVNATHMCQKFGKKANDFLRLVQTKSFIQAWEAQSEDAPTRKNSVYYTVQGGNAQSQGTWMHRQLALKLAAWLSPEFEIWIFKQIEAMLFGGNDELTKLRKRVDELEASRGCIYSTPEYKWLKAQSEDHYKEYQRVANEHFKTLLELNEVLKSVPKYCEGITKQLIAACEIRDPYKRGQRVAQIRQQFNLGA